MPSLLTTRDSTQSPPQRPKPPSSSSTTPTRDCKCPPTCYCKTDHSYLRAGDRFPRTRSFTLADDEVRAAPSEEWDVRGKAGRLMRMQDFSRDEGVKHDVGVDVGGGGGAETEAGAGSESDDSSATAVDGGDVAPSRSSSKESRQNQQGCEEGNKRTKERRRVSICVGVKRWLGLRNRMAST